MVMSGATEPQSRALGTRSREHGFTLVELLVAILLAGILAVVAIVGLTGITGAGNKSQCSTLLDAAKSAATTYYAKNGAYPATAGASPIGFDALTSGSPAVFTVPQNVSASGNVMSTTKWSITMTGGGSNVPNGFVKTGTSGAACS
jgi:prepilin-type N-terminal cleavage/methylation domain-containing protein